MTTYLSGKTDFLRCLTLCHDCTILEVDAPRSKGGDTKQKLLTGSSLDEQCLLNKVKSLGAAQFAQRTAQSIQIEIEGRVEDYDVLAINEFTSERKLMSLIVRSKATGQLFVFAKGAES